MKTKNHLKPIPYEDNKLLKSLKYLKVIKVSAAAIIIGNLLFHFTCNAAYYSYANEKR